MRLPLRFVLATMLVPSVAHAKPWSLRLRPRPTFAREGLLVGAAAHVGVDYVGPDPQPLVRARAVLGGGVSDKATIAVESGVHKPLGFDSRRFGVDLDLVATGYVGRLYLRGGVGASSWVATRARDPFAPGVGGLAGFGFEFRIEERLGLALGLDYDVRVRPDRRLGVNALLGVRLTHYVGRRKRHDDEDEDMYMIRGACLGPVPTPEASRRCRQSQARRSRLRR